MYKFLSALAIASIITGVSITSTHAYHFTKRGYKDFQGSHYLYHRYTPYSQPYQFPGYNRYTQTRGYTLPTRPYISKRGGYVTPYNYEGYKGSLTYSPRTAYRYTRQYNSRYHRYYDSYQH